MHPRKTNLTIEGAFLLESDTVNDQRGAFTSFWDEKAGPSLDMPFSPSSFLLSKNLLEHTLRGLHYQHAPHGQRKLVTCLQGKACDVILDLRPGSPTRHQWEMISLDASTPKAIHIPAGCAHGFLTLEENTWISYLIEGDYVPAASAAVRWNDPLFSIPWPVSEPILSPKDQNAPDYTT